MEPQVLIDLSAPGSQGDDHEKVEMSEQNDVPGEEMEDIEAPTGLAEAEVEAVIEAALQEDGESSSFLETLKSTVIQIDVGAGEEQITLSAHQALLSRSAYFASAIADLPDEVTPKRLYMLEESIDAMGCVLQYLYTGEYFPKKLPDNRLEIDTPDNGEQLLKHARVYTLAGKLELKELEELALSKVHLVQSSAKGEIEYARYVYRHTTKADKKIRKPIAGFWGARSHVLRHEAEYEFKQLCIDYPEFAFDVLTCVLDSRERRDRRDQESEVTKSARKRQRQT